MKKFTFLLFSVIFNLHFCFAACEEERLRSERARDLCNRWTDYSRCTAVAGTIIGGLIFPPLGGLCGAAGLIPGAVAKRVCDLADRRDDVLRKCEEDHAFEQKQALEMARAQLAKAQIEAISKDLTEMSMDILKRFEQRCENEIDELIESYTDSNCDLTDPKIIEQMEVEIEAIRKKYF